VYNIQVIEEWIERGDIVALARDPTPAEVAYLAAEARAPDTEGTVGPTDRNKVNNLVELGDPTEIIAEDVPPDEYFNLLEADLRKRFPGADEDLYEHVVSIERYLWHCCAFGVSCKAKKAQLVRACANMLGEYLGRGVIYKDPAKSEAIRLMPYPNSLKTLQEFLGMFNYIRPRCVPSSGQWLHILKPWLRKADFPLTQAAKEAIDELKKLAVQQVAISALDEEAAVMAFHADEEVRYRNGPIRPIESLADSSGFAIGAGAVQMEEGLKNYSVLACYSAGLTITQMQQHPFTQELWAQLMAKRFWVKTIGSYPALYMTDHAKLVRLCMLALNSDRSQALSLVPRSGGQRIGDYLPRRTHDAPRRQLQP
jgi:hypothetical protein